ncbi:transposase family protein [Nonomuraea sp. 3N208]|uniref:transposase family protein n=1 Tax=Nonomuraea sp. 3N208 TaxID=3457421 RepID=UPI003FD15B70
MTIPALRPGRPAPANRWRSTPDRRRHPRVQREATPPAEVWRRVTTTKQPAEGDTSAVYTVRLPLSTTTITFLADLLRRHLKAIGSRWRKLPPGKIAIIVLAILRHDQRLSDLAGGNHVSASTIGRWVKEAIGLLAARAPRLERALKKIAAAGGEVVLLDGTQIPTRRRTGGDNRKNFSGKHKRHGLRFLALTDTRGRLLWISAARRGAASEITAARHDHLCAQLREHGLGALADLGFIGLDDQPNDDPVIITGFKASRWRPLTPARRQANRLLAAERAPVEHGFAHLKAWRVLTQLRTDLNPGHHPAARPARADHPRSQPLTDDHPP